MGDKPQEAEEDHWDVVVRREDPPRLKVINLWAGPGAGKSTLAAGLFNLMKNRGYSVELVVEWAKEAVYEERLTTLSDNQLYVLAKQDQRLRRLIGKSVYAITDSPLPLSLLYRADSGPFSEDWFKDTVLRTWRSYENVNVIVERVKPYSTQGRTQSAIEAQKIDFKTNDLVKKLDMQALKIRGDEEGPYELLKRLEAGFKIIGDA